MATYYTSDLHLGHERVIELCNRPYGSIKQMNEAIIYNWNSVVTEEDYVFVLGDLAMGNIAETLKLTERLNGIRILVPGNHDRCWSNYRNSGPRVDDLKMYTDSGWFLHPQNYIDPNTKWRFCHFPYAGDVLDKDRYTEHRPVRTTEKALIHGHVHNLWRMDSAKRQINVGVDAWDFFPVKEDILERLIDTWPLQEELSSLSS